VMAVNKVGLAELVVRPPSGPAFVVEASRDLSPLQAEQVAWQPDLILQWAHIVARDEQQRLGTPVEVYADVWVSVNGRPPARLIDMTVDLARQRWSPLRPSWVLPAPTGL
jgi:vitamin K-dependent gamma-carboxylase